MQQLALIEPQPTLASINHSIPLLAPFPGNKGKRKYWGIHDGGDYDCTLEMFAGSGGFTFFNPQAPRSLFCADADPAVRAVWQCFKSNHLRGLCSDDVNFWIDCITSGYAQTSWNALCKLFNTQGDGSVTMFAAASILIRKLCFGAYVRMNTSGQLNIALSQDKLNAFSTWSHKWPDALDYLSITRHYNAAALQLKHSSFQSAIAVIDPPYWVPYAPGSARRGTGAMTPAYPGHKPSHDGLFRDCIYAIESALSTGKVKRAVVFNYYSRRLHGAIMTTAKRFGLPCYYSNLGTLGGSNNAQNFYERFDEGVWEIGGKRMFKDVPKRPVQLSIEV